MRRSIKLKRGLSLNLAGGVAQGSPVREIKPTRVALVPDDFPGIVPKPEVKEGDSVAAGQPLLRDKTCPAIKLVAPVAGTVEAIVRGERRKIERVVVKADGSDRVTAIEVNPSDAVSVREALQQSGLWAMIRRRPFDIVAQASDIPRDIFVTAFDLAPLAPDLEAEVAGHEKEIEAGVKALASLTEGKVYISVASQSQLPDYAGAEMIEIDGRFPASNPGVQAANIAPVNKGDVIWTLDIVTLMRIGALMLTGKAPQTTLVALTGSELENPCMVSTVIGADTAQLLEGNVKADGRNHRVISGNVLTGVRVEADGFLRYPYRQLTVIPEGDDADEFMGWASMAPSKMSESRSFPGHFLFKKLFSPDARLHGGRRAMIMSGEYDKVFPMDILPEYLVKAIIARDIDRMEALGIYEVAPEDFAAAEYVDPSKLELQRLVREGLDYLRKEIS